MFAIRKPLLAALALLGVFLSTSCYAADSVGDTAKNTGEQILKAVPDGGSVSADDFIKNVSPELSVFVKQLKVSKLSRKGDHLVLTCTPGPLPLNGNSFNLDVDGTVEFDLQTGAKELLKLSGLKGLAVSAGDKTSSGKVSLQELTVTDNGDGTSTTNVKLSAELNFTK